MILHVDMDAFYASVEERDNPSLVGRPVIVGGTPEQRGVVCAANYVARRFGVHSAMPSSTAKRLCPQAVFLPSRIDYYAGISREIREIFYRFTPLVEPLSLDEAFLDVTPSEQLFGTSAEIGQQIKLAIKEELSLVASVGVGPNKFIAKIASDFRKPDGFHVVEAAEVGNFLDPLPIERIWGVGRVTGKSFARLGIRTVGELRQLEPDILAQMFGAYGKRLWELAHGIDDRVVTPDRVAKSISHETTFPSDIDDVEHLRAWLIELTEQVARRLRQNDLLAKTVQLKVRFENFELVTRSKTLPTATANTDLLWKSADELLRSRIPLENRSIRLLGVGVSEINSERFVQLQLFDQEDELDRQQLDHATDLIRERFGKDAVQRAIALNRIDQRKR